MKMARLFHADSRWVMTGTPTPNTLQSADLQHMYGLLVFLRDRPYGNAGRKAWLKAIVQPFEQHDRAGYVRLVQLLSRIMMRHTKKSIQALIPTPIRHVVYVDPSPREYAMYNGIAAAARTNIVVTNMDPHTPGKLHPDSMLNPINRKHALQMMKNLRDATGSNRRIQATLSERAYSETVRMLHGLNVSPDRVEEIKQYMRDAQDASSLVLCTLCERRLQFVMLVPCGHLSCADCVGSQYDSVGPSCGVCSATYDPEDLQRLQPGFDWAVVDEELAYNHRPVDGGGVRIGRRGRNEASGIPTPEPGVANRRRTVAMDLTRFETIHTSKAFYVANRVNALRVEYHEARVAQQLQHGTPWQAPLPPKVIIFSQFNEHIWRTKIALAQQGIMCADFITGVTARWRMQSVHKFRQDPDSNVLLLTAVGSHGLNLSFVTHIFLMDEIWDKSLESQVISRAHRMGARQSVVVEQLLMRGSVEEVMHKMNQRNSYGMSEDEDDEDTVAESRGTDHQASERDRIKSEPSASGEGSDQLSKSTILQRQLQAVLQNLRLIEPNAVAEVGFVKFKVVDENGTIVRDSKLKLPNAGGRPDAGIPQTSSSTGSARSAPESRRDDPTAVDQLTLNTRINAFTPTVASPPPPARPATSTSTAARPKKTVRIATQEPSPAKNPQPQPGLSPTKEKAVTVKAEPRSTDPVSSRKRAPPPLVIDLTSDGDSDSAVDATPPVRRIQEQPRYVHHQLTSRAEEDGGDSGSETEDEWAPVKLEATVKREVIKVEPPSQQRPPADGKRKRRIVDVE